MRYAIIGRFPDQSKQTLGKIQVMENKNLLYECCTIELPWRDNQRMVSCIPEDMYIVVKRYTPKFGHHFHVLNVPGRSGILWHIANYSRQLKGCVAPGLRHIDIDRDGLKDVANSTRALKDLNHFLPDKFPLIVKTV